MAYNHHEQYGNMTHGNLTRESAIRLCVDHMRTGRGFLYLTASRESSHEVRNRIMTLAGGLANGQVLGLDNLIRGIVQARTNGRRVIGRQEQRMLLDGVVTRMPCRAPFSLVTDKPGFLHGLSSLMVHWKREDFDPATMQDLAAMITAYPDKPLSTRPSALPATLPDIAHEKLVFLTHVHHLYQQRLDALQLLDPEDLTVLAKAIVNRNEWACSAELLIVDGFRGFHRIEKGLLDAIATAFPQMAVHFIPPSALTGTHGEPAERTIPIPRLQAHPCLDEEIRNVAGTIRHLLAEKGTAPNRIALTCPDMKEYQAPVASIFRELTLPLSEAMPLKLADIPLVRDLMALLRLRIEAQQDAAMLTLTSSKYLQPAMALSIGEASGFSPVEASDLSPVEASDLSPVEASAPFPGAWMDTLQQFHPEQTASPVEALAQFSSFLGRLPLEQALAGLSRSGMLTEALLLRDWKALRLFRRLLSSHLDLMRRNLSKPSIDNLREGIDAEQYASTVNGFALVLSGTDAGFPYRDPGGIRLLPLEAFTGQTYDYVFVLGLQEGAFPKPFSSFPGLSPTEAAAFRQVGIPLPNPEEAMDQASLRFHTLLRAAKKGLELHWRTCDEDGGLMNGSPFLDPFRTSSFQPSAPIPAISMRERVLRLPVSRSWSARKAAEMERMRFTKPFGTHFDGLLSNPTLTQQDAAFGFSVSQLNHYARCPFLYFSERVLGMKEDAPETPLDARLLGTFLHAVLKAWHARPISASRETPPDLAQLDALFDLEVKTLDFSQLPKRVAERRKQELRGILADFVTADAENLDRFHQQTGNHLVPTLLEVPFTLAVRAGSGPDSAAAIPGYRLRGIIDRVDLEMTPEGNPTGRYVLVDYKSRKPKDLQDVISGQDFQLPLYRAAIRPLLRDRLGREPECLALLWYGVEACEWKGLVRNDMKKILFAPRKRPILLTGDHLDILQSWVEEEAGKAVCRIRSGHFAQHRLCPATEFFPCPYVSLCRTQTPRMQPEEGRAPT